MTRYCVAALAAALCVPVAIAQTSRERAEEEVRAYIGKLGRENIPRFTADGVYVGPRSPEVISGEALRKMAAQPQPPNAVVTHHVVRLSASESGDVVYDLSNVTVDLADGTPPYEGLVMRVWRRVDGKWHIDVQMSRRK